MYITEELSAITILAIPSFFYYLNMNLWEEMTDSKSEIYSNF